MEKSLRPKSDMLVDVGLVGLLFECAVVEVFELLMMRDGIVRRRRSLYLLLKKNPYVIDPIFAYCKQKELSSPA